MDLARAAFHHLVERDHDHECEGYGSDHVCVRIAATAALPSRFGDFHVVGFWNPVDEKEHAAFVHSDVALGAEDVPVRLHSECLADMRTKAKKSGHLLGLPAGEQGDPPVIEVAARPPRAVRNGSGRRSRQLDGAAATASGGGSSDGTR